MGYYINPPSTSKENWLTLHARFMLSPTTRSIEYEDRPGEHWVCLVDNGSFTAGGIAYNKGEFDAFNQPDGRTKLWFSVPDRDLLEICPHVPLSKAAA